MASKIMQEFERWSCAAAYYLGHPVAFVGACAGTAVWAACGPIFNYSDTWQLVINTLTTVLTFLAVFLIQNSQNHGDAAIQAKLDELIRASKARDDLIQAEAESTAEIERLRPKKAAPSRS